MNKPALISCLKTQLKNQLDRALAAVETAAEGATGEDTKAESKYDTRGLESSYLAAGQAGQVDEIARVLQGLDQFEFPDFNADTQIDVGALVEIECEGDRDFYLLAPGGGGLVCEDNAGNTATVLGPGAPLANRLLDLKTGDAVGDSAMRVISVC